MRKPFSILLSIMLILPMMLVSLYDTTLAETNNREIQYFIDETLVLLRENDLDKEFVCENDVPIDETWHENSYEGTDSNNDFQTCRLIVQSSQKIDELNSIGIASGFLNYYIVQFENEADTQAGYEYYLEQESIISVSPDLVFKAECDYTTNSDGNITYDGVPDRLESWGSKITGIYEVKDYCVNNYANLPEIKIAVIDSGVDLNHEFLQDRLVETGFNFTSDGSIDSEQDAVRGHGTKVSSIIADSTPSNVKIANYRVLDDNGNTTTSAIIDAILQATIDKVDFINISLSCTYSPPAVNDAIKSAYQNGITIVTSAGNSSWDIEYVEAMPAGSEYAITIGASTPNNLPTSWSNRGKPVDVLAPGQDLPAATPNNTYALVSGTSFSAPLVVSIAAMIKSLNSNATKEKIEVLLESTALKSDMLGDIGFFGYGIVDAIGACDIDRVTAPALSLKSGKYIGYTTLEIVSEPESKVYYTIDGTYPSPGCGIEYTEPISFHDDIMIFRAVAYSKDKLRSNYVKEIYRFSTLGTDDMFEIDKNGIITAYKGSVYDLTIPETINGITVSGLSENVFSECVIYGVSFPQNITILPKKLFYANNYIQFVDGEGIKEIGDNAFRMCSALYDVFFPNVEKIGNQAFRSASTLCGIDFPNCTYIGYESFFSTTIRYAHLPAVKEIQYHAFKKCTLLYDIQIPSVNILYEESYNNGVHFGGSTVFGYGSFLGTLEIPTADRIPTGAFLDSEITRVELSNAVTINSLPVRCSRKPKYGAAIVALPSTVISCSWGSLPYTESETYYKINFKVYGTEKTFSEQWAKDNGYEFCPISQQTALITDLPTEYYSYMFPLEADVVGFNKTYQWYGANTNNNTDGVRINGATERKFDPNKYKQYKYYYCVVTSTDVGYEPIEIRTGVTENKSYKPYSPTFSNGRVTIATPSNRYLKYGESMVLYANATGLPKGAKIKWRIVEGSGVTLDPSVSGAICTVTSKSNGNVIIEAYAVNKNGNTIVNEKGNRIYDREGISSEVSLWWIILYYIKTMFGIAKTAML